MCYRREHKTWQGELVMSDIDSTGYELGLLFGLKPKQVMEGIRLYYKISRHEDWDCRRSNYSLMLDCIYLTGKKYKTGITMLRALELTKEHYGVATHPRPNRWQAFL